VVKYRLEPARIPKNLLEDTRLRQNLVPIARERDFTNRFKILVKTENPSLRSPFTRESTERPYYWRTYLTQSLAFARVHGPPRQPSTHIHVSWGRGSVGCSSLSVAPLSVRPDDEILQPWGSRSDSSYFEQLAANGAWKCLWEGRAACRREEIARIIERRLPGVRRDRDAVSGCDPYLLVAGFRVLCFVRALKAAVSGQSRGANNAKR